MKKLILLFFFSTSFIVHSQVRLYPGFRIGVNYSTIVTSSNMDNYQYKPKKGLYIGALLNIQYSKFYALQPELSYSNQGGKAEFLRDKKINIHYFSISAINKFFIMKDKKLHFLIGPSFDININDSDLINEKYYELDSSFYGADFSFFLGLGYQFDFGLTLEARYKKGISGIFNDDYKFIFTKKDGARKNSLFQFGIAYKFDLKKESKKIAK